LGESMGSVLTGAAGISGGGGGWTTVGTVLCGFTCDWEVDRERLGLLGGGGSNANRPSWRYSRMSELRLFRSSRVRPSVRNSVLTGDNGSVAGAVIEALAIAGVVGDIVACEEAMIGAPSTVCKMCEKETTRRRQGLAKKSAKLVQGEPHDVNPSHRFSGLVHF
jgi:hypothetical protein